MEILRVLVVDDEPGIRLGIGAGAAGFTVRVPDLNGEVAFRGLAGRVQRRGGAVPRVRRRPDILLLDHKLPGITGLEVLDLTSKKPHDLLTVMITAYATIDTAVQATKRGAHDFLAKPFTPDELKSTIHKAAKHLVLQRRRAGWPRRSGRSASSSSGARPRAEGPARRDRGLPRGDQGPGRPSPARPSSTSDRPQHRCASTGCAR